MSEKKHISRVFPAWAQDIIADPKASTEELKRAYAAEIVTESEPVASPQATRPEPPVQSRSMLKRVAAMKGEPMPTFDAAQSAAGTTPRNCPQHGTPLTADGLCFWCEVKAGNIPKPEGPNAPTLAEDDLRDAVMFLRIVLTRKDMAALNCLKPKIADWLKRRGHEGSILRETE